MHEMPAPDGTAELCDVHAAANGTDPTLLVSTPERPGSPQ